MTNLYTIAIALVVSVLIFIGGFNYMPFPVDTLGENTLGVAITEINGSDTIKNFPTSYNATINALNDGKIENSTTSLPLITTLSGLTSAASLSTVGTIGTGVWQGTDVGVAYGGTGTSTLTAYSVLLGNGTNYMTNVAGLGTSGQFLTSNGAGVAPTWTSASVNQTLDYIWTGNHYWNTASTTFNGMSYMNNLVISSSTLYQYPTASTSPATKGYVDTNATAEYSFGVREKTNASGEETFAHGLSKTPEKIKITAKSYEGSESNYHTSVGMFNGTTYATVYDYKTSTDNSTSYIAVVGFSGTVMVATSTIDATNIKIGWQETGSLPNNIDYLWEAWIN